MPIGRSVRDELKRRTSRGDLVQFSSGQSDSLWADPATLENRTARVSNRVRILSPFDNAITHRDRLLDIFDFDYQLECFLPAEKRRYGYFCLPILYADRLIGRMDCKSHRDSQRFEVKALYFEAQHSHRERILEVSLPLAAALEDYAKFEGCNEITITRSHPASAKQALVIALKR